MLKENNCVESPQVIIKGTAISDSEKIPEPQHSTVGDEGRVKHLEPDMNNSDSDKMTTIKISYNTKHLESDLKKDDTDKMTTLEVSYSTKERLDALKTDRESYESLILRLIEESAARACCAARWM